MIPKHVASRVVWSDPIEIPDEGGCDVVPRQGVFLISVDPRQEDGSFLPSTHGHLGFDFDETHHHAHPCVLANIVVLLSARTEADPRCRNMINYCSGIINPNI